MGIQKLIEKYDKCLNVRGTAEKLIKIHLSKEHNFLEGKCFKFITIIWMLWIYIMLHHCKFEEIPIYPVNIIPLLLNKCTVDKYCICKSQFCIHWAVV